MPSRNGRGRLVVILSALVVSGIGSMLAFAIHESAATGEDLDTHAGREGHPVLVERVEAIKGDLDEIKTEQKSQGGKIDTIYRSVVGEPPPP